MSWHCSQIDCPLHPTYKKQEQIVAEKKKQKEEEERLEELRKNPPIDKSVSYDTIAGHGHLTAGSIVYDPNNSSMHLSDGVTYNSIYPPGVVGVSANTIIGGCTINDNPWQEIGINMSDTLTLNIPNLDHPIPVECLMCCHMEKIDMRDTIIVGKAKRALEED